MAEVEYFVDPENKKLSRFDEVKGVELTFLSKQVQLAGKTETQKMSIGKAVEIGLVDNETLGYFLARIQQFLMKLGIDQTKLRYRQHMANEMAHYACDCWDAELHTSHGWIECVGCADRSAYDLTVHAKRTGEALVVREPRPEPLKIEEWQIDLQKKKLGPKFRKDAKAVEAAVEALTQAERETMAERLKTEGSITLDVSGVDNVILDDNFIDIVKRTRIENIREYTPNVIEPSFGIGRILYCLMEHVFWHRPDSEERGVLSFPPLVAPTKVLIVPLSNHPSFAPFVKKFSQRLRTLGIAYNIDDSSTSIGKRYSRNDELGTPFGVTIDFDTVKTDTLTLRERDSTKQVRASDTEITAAIKSLVEAGETWEDVFKRLPEFTGQTVND